MLINSLSYEQIQIDALNLRRSTQHITPWLYMSCSKTPSLALTENPTPVAVGWWNRRSRVIQIRVSVTLI